MVAPVELVALNKVCQASVDVKSCKHRLDVKLVV